MPPCLGRLLDKVRNVSRDTCLQDLSVAGEDGEEGECVPNVRCSISEAMSCVEYSMDADASTADICQ